MDKQDSSIVSVNINFYIWLDSRFSQQTRIALMRQLQSVIRSYSFILKKSRLQHVAPFAFMFCYPIPSWAIF